MAFLEELKEFDIPTCLRVCSGTDGSVTFLLEIMTREDVSVITEFQEVVSADEEQASILGIEVGENINYRTVTLLAGDVRYVHATSLSPLSRMPLEMQQDLIRADIPIGKILRKHGIETRRDFDSIKIEQGTELFGATEILSRTYRIMHQGFTLMWIYESFPVDDRWKL
ncbi:chorismate--pyruvate lyase family protein [Methanosalsum natronophilum]|uniref:chorismate--pyruvate lyase family protein n=1 Tax=Methanosalsum natronophilum TaxID=768733 RepID=UPI002169FE96|nr:chorismate pyruvate-lyase family protein [Methanosalsum natronophilum]MCS3924772.1 chorismate-pyruvate lyase [Methanosalsum natronophilum]